MEMVTTKATRQAASFEAACTAWSRILAGGLPTLGVLETTDTIVSVMKSLSVPVAMGKSKSDACHRLSQMVQDALALDPALQYIVPQLPGMPAAVTRMGKVACRVVVATDESTGKHTMLFSAVVGH